MCCVTSFTSLPPDTLRQTASKVGNQTRELFKRELEKMISDANEKHQVVLNLQRAADQKRDFMEILNRTASSSRARKGLDNPMEVDAQIKLLDEQAEKEMGIVRAMWDKIHNMQQEERALWGT